MKQEVNLYQVGERRKVISRLGLSAVLVLLGLIALLTAISLHTKYQTRDLSSRLQAAKEQRQNLLEQVKTLQRKVSEQDYQKLRARIQKLSAQRGARKKLLQVVSDSGSSRQSGFAPFLEVLAREDISGLWLTGFEIDLQREPTLRLMGKALDSKRIPEYLLRLSEEEIFSGYTFEKLSAERLKGQDEEVIGFTLATKGK